MMTASKPRQVPPPAEGAKAHPYTRFIPREEVASFAAWALGDLKADRRSAAPGPASQHPGRRSSDEPAPQRADPAELLAQQLKAARQAGYQDGYRDGLVALDGFKQSYAAQTTAQVGTLVRQVGEQLDAMQQQMAASLVACATALAQRVVRSELQTRPECIADVAGQAVEALLLSAKHVVLRVHPDDLALVAAGAGESISARGARLVADAAIGRGGCRVDCDIGGVEATIEERWRQAAAAIGSVAPWRDEAAAARNEP